MEAGAPNTLENQKWLQVSIEILVRIPQLDTYGPLASLSRLSLKQIDNLIV